MLPDMSKVTNGGWVSAIATRTFSSWSSLHLIIIVLPSDFTSLMPAFSIAIEPKSSRHRFAIALIASFAWPACMIERYRRFARLLSTRHTSCLKVFCRAIRSFRASAFPDRSHSFSVSRLGIDLKPFHSSKTRRSKEPAGTARNDKTSKAP